MEESSICVIDREGQVALETRVTIDPDAIFRVLKPYVSKLRRLGHVTGRQHPLPADTEQLTLPVYCTPKGTESDNHVEAVATFPKCHDGGVTVRFATCLWPSAFAGERTARALALRVGRYDRA